jgi:hypothetical protein
VSHWSKLGVSAEYLGIISPVNPARFTYGTLWFVDLHVLGPSVKLLEAFQLHVLGPSKTHCRKPSRRPEGLLEISRRPCERPFGRPPKALLKDPYWHYEMIGVQVDNI